MKHLGTILLYIGGLVWVVYAIAKYYLGWDVTIRQFLPYHLATIIPGILLKRGYWFYERFFGRRKRRVDVN